MLRKIIIYLISLFILAVFIQVKVEAATYNSDWIGTIEKSYEMAWKQQEGIQGGKPFVLEYTYLMDGFEKYVSYCIDYYTKGPRNDSNYGSVPLESTSLQDYQKSGIIKILQHGYPNVELPFGTLDASEAYYATSAAIHIWAMYFGIDSRAAEGLRWFRPSDGFNMTKENLERYIVDNSTVSTSYGGHIIGANNNDSSVRTWDAAMNLLIVALEKELKKPVININKVNDAVIEEGYLRYEYEVLLENCEIPEILAQTEIDGLVTNLSEKNKYNYILSIKIPLDKVNSFEKYSFMIKSIINSSCDLERFIYSYHLTGTYQTMVYHNNSNSIKQIDSKFCIEIPDLERKVFYDLNYSQKNYIKHSDTFSNKDKGYNGDLIYNAIGNTSMFNTTVSQNLDYKAVKVKYLEKPSFNSCFLINTCLNSSKSDGFAGFDDDYYTLGFFVKSDKITNINIAFKNGRIIGRKNIPVYDKWIYVSLILKKNEIDNNYICFFPDDICELSFYFFQLEDGKERTTYIVENAPPSLPASQKYMLGDKYSSLYNGKVPVRDNYIFKGWNTKKDGSGIFITEENYIINGNVVLYAIWETKDSYNIYYHYGTNGGSSIIYDGAENYSSDKIEKVQIKSGCKVSIDCEGVREGWEFIGWSFEDSLKEGIEEKAVKQVEIIDHDVHLYANYRKKHQARFHFYNQNTGTENVRFSEERYSYNLYNYKGLIILPGNIGTDKIPEPEKYSLIGWSINPYEKTKINFTPKSTVSLYGCIDYYAVYEKEINVRFYDNKHKNIDQIKYHQDNSFLHSTVILKTFMNCIGDKEPGLLNLPDKVCGFDCYEFLGWSNEPAFSGSIIFDKEQCGTNVSVYDDLDLYALFGVRFNIFFNDYDFRNNSIHLEKKINCCVYKNFSGLVRNPQIYTPFCCETDEGWQFEGWSPNNKAASTKIYPANEKITVSKEQNYYAVYNNNISIKFHYFEGENELEEKCLGYTKKIKMSCTKNFAGAIVEIIKPPDIINGGNWSCIGFTTNKDVYEQKFNIGEEYEFKNNTDLYSVYGSKVNVDFYDYNVEEKKTEKKSQKSDIKMNYNRNISGDKLEFPNCISSDFFDYCGWSSNSDSKGDIEYEEGNSIEIKANIKFFSVYKKLYWLTAEDFFDSEVRIRDISAFEKTSYNGRVVDAKVVIPEAGNLNGSNFSGFWSEEESFTPSFYPNSQIKLDRNIRISGVYRKDFNLILDANGGCFNDNTSIRKVPLTMYQIPSGKIEEAETSLLEEPIREGYRFKYNWSINNEGEGESYPSFSQIKTNKELTLYAQWSPVLNPEITAPDRYFFVGDDIDYDNLIKRVKVYNTKTEIASNIKIISINGIHGEYNTKEIKKKINSKVPSFYKVVVSSRIDELLLEKSFMVYIVSKNRNLESLRFISDEYIDSLSDDSKWRDPYNDYLLNMYFNKDCSQCEKTISLTFDELKERL